MWQRAFRAFRYPNYRWFFWGQIGAMMGSWMQQVAIAWLVYEKTGSAFLLGAISTASLLPGLFIGPLAGVAADRWERRKIVRWANLGFVLQALLLTNCYLYDFINVPVLLLLAILLGIFQGFDWPVRQSLVVDLVDEREDVGNAIALNSTSWNLARLLGPLLGGILVGLGWIGLCFFFNALASLWAWFTIGRIAPRRRTRTAVERHPLVELREGIAYALTHPLVRSCITIPAASSVLVLPYTAMLPIVASEWLRGGPKLYGLLSAAPAFGAVFGGLYLASRPDNLNLPRMIRFSGISAAIALMAFALSRNTLITVLLLAALGICFILQISSVNTLLQLTVTEDMRGRILALYTSVFTGAFPVGLVLCGALADIFGAAEVLFAGGCVGAVVLAWITSGSAWRASD